MQPGVAKVSRPVTIVGQSARLCGRTCCTAAVGCSCLPCICVPGAVWPPFFGLPMRTRGLKHGCEQFDARRGPGGEPERRECAILLVLSRLCRRKFRSLCVQNSGPLGTQTLSLGSLEMPNCVPSPWYIDLGAYVVFAYKIDPTTNPSRCTCTCKHLP